MKLSYKGWFISCHPRKKEDVNAIEFRYWDVVLEDKHSEKTHTFGVTTNYTLSEIEKKAFDKIDELVKNDNKKQIRLSFIQYLNNQKEDSNEFNLHDCLMYFKNKSLEETMVLLKFINKNKYNYLKSL